VICTAYFFTGFADGNSQLEIKNSDDQNNSLVSSSPVRPQSPLSPTDRTFGNKVSKHLCLQMFGMSFLWQCVLRLTFLSMWCGLVGWYQSVRGISCLHLQGGRCEDDDSRLL